MGQVLEGFGAEGSDGDTADGVGGALGDVRQHEADAILTATLDRGLVAVGSSSSSSSSSSGGGGGNSGSGIIRGGVAGDSSNDSKDRGFLAIGQGQGNAAEPHNAASDLLMHSLELERSRSDVYHLAQLKRKGRSKTNARAAEATKETNTQRAGGEDSVSEGCSGGGDGQGSRDTTVNHNDGTADKQQAVFSRSTSWEYESRVTHSDVQSYSLFDESGDAFVGGVSPLLATGDASPSPVSTEAGAGGRPLSEFVRVVGGSGLSGVWSEGSEATRRPSSAERCLQRRLRMAEQRLEQHRRQSLAQLRQYEQAISQILCPLVLSPRSVEDIKAVTVCKQKQTHWAQEMSRGSSVFFARDLGLWCLGSRVLSPVVCFWERTETRLPRNVSRK